MESNRLAIIIPFYNEVLRFHTNLFLNFAESNLHIDWYFVNDGSTDSTSQVLESVKKRNPKLKITIIDLDNNLGKAQAVRKGVLLALEYNYDYIGFIDGDMQIPLAQINNLFKALNGSTVKLALSVRNFKQHLSIFNLRSIISYLFMHLNKKIIRADITLKDTQCGCKLFMAKEGLTLFEKPFISRWLFDLELILRLRNRSEISKETIREVPLAGLMPSTGSKLRILQNLNLINELRRINLFYNK